MMATDGVMPEFMRKDKKDVVVKGILTEEEYKKFLNDFCELEVRRQTIITDKKTEDGKILVTLRVFKVMGFMIRASLEDGLLHYWGWDKKFQIQE